MYRTGMGENKILIHGGRTLDSFYFSNELASAFGNRYVRCCSQEDSPEVFHGRVTQYLQELNSLPSEMKYYLCGSAEMVVECREILLAKGVPFNQIVAEIYF
jgi:ferredoxin--NADP+ reductase